MFYFLPGAVDSLEVHPLVLFLACAAVPLEWLELLMDTSGQMGFFQRCWPCKGLGATAQLGCQGTGWSVPWCDVSITPLTVSVSVC